MKWLRRLLDFLAGFPPPEMPNWRPEDYRQPGKKRPDEPSANAIGGAS